MEALKPADVEPTYQDCNDFHIALSAKKCRRHRACLHIYLCHPSVVLFCKNYISSAWKTLVSLGNISRQGEAKVKSGQESRASKCCIQHEEFGGHARPRPAWLLLQPGMWVGVSRTQKCWAQHSRQALTLTLWCGSGTPSPELRSREADKETVVQFCFRRG